MTAPARIRPVGEVAARFWAEMGPARRPLVVGLVLAMVDAACQVSLPLLLRSVMNRLNADPSQVLRAGLLPLVVKGLALTAGFYGVALLSIPKLSLARIGCPSACASTCLSTFRSFRKTSTSSGGWGTSPSG